MSHRHPIPNRAAPVLALLLTLPALGLAQDGIAVPEKTYPLGDGGTFSLENVNGDVTVTGWDRPEVSVAAVKRGAHADSAQVKVTATKDAVHVDTELPSSSGWSWRGSSATVDYTIKVPKGCRIQAVEVVNGSVKIEGISGSVAASTVNGTLEAKDLSGDADIETVNGSLSVTLARLDASQTVSLSSVNGSIAVKLAAGVGADVEGETINGRITSDLGLKVEKGQWVGASLSGRVGAGGGRIKIETVNGPISVDKL